jgi:MFS family permease
MDRTSQTATSHLGASGASFSLLAVYTIVIALSESIRFLLPLVPIASQQNYLASGVLFSLTYLPALVFGLVAGMFNDMYDRRKLLILYTVVIVFSAVALPFTAIGGISLMPMLGASLILLIAGYFCINLIFGLARQFVQTSQLSKLNARMGSSSTLAELVVPLLLGGLLAFPYMRPDRALSAIFLLSLTIIVPVLFLIRIPQLTEEVAVDAKATPSVQRGSGTLGSAYNLLRSEDTIRSSTFIMALSNAADALFYSNALFLLSSSSDGGALSLGSVFTAGAAGALVGSWLAPKFYDRFAQRGALTLTSVALALIYTFPAVLPTYYCIVVAAAFQGLASMLTVHYVYTKRHELTPHHIASSMVGLTGAFYKSLVIFCAPLGAILFTSISSTSPMILAVVLSVLCSIYAGSGRVRVAMMNTEAKK